MRKILLTMILATSTMAYADEGRYTIGAKSGDSNFVWILDSKNGKLKYCYKLQGTTAPIYCSKWKDIED